MTKTERRRLLANMIRNVKRTIRKIEQLIRDSEWWNAHRTDCEPLDVGRDKVTLNLLRKHQRELETLPPGSRIKGQYLKRIMEIDEQERNQSSCQNG